MPETAFLQYITMVASDNARTDSVDQLEGLLRKIIDSPALAPTPRILLDPDSFRVTGVPSRCWRPEIVGWSGTGSAVVDVNEIVVPCAFRSEADLLAFRDHLFQAVDRDIAGEIITNIGANPGGAIADHYSPAHDGAAFATRREARRMLGLETTRADFGDSGPGRAKVNVVILDQGLNKAAIPEPNWGGGWAYEPPKWLPPLPGLQPSKPGEAEARSHGMMLARNILDVAPSAVLYDFPVIPLERIANVSLFADHADAAYRYLLATIIALRLAGEKWQGPWIIVNAWGIVDRSTEIPLGDYTEDANPTGHALNKVVGQMVAERIDVVFAAGNCGQFTMSSRCGPADRGPGHSIWGANSHPSVLTVGAVLSNDMWLGYSAQGPGQRRLDTNKPDVCAPSQFRDTNDAAMLNTGTSAASAMMAGVLALLRSKWPASLVTPAEMKRVIATSAVGSRAPGESGRFGAGIPNADKAWDLLTRGPPWPWV